MGIGLAETLAQLREELEDAAVAGAGADIRFPVTGVQVEFHVAVKKEGSGNAGIKVWVVEAGGSASLSREEVHKVVVTLGAPADREDRPLVIDRGYAGKP